MVAFRNTTLVPTPSIDAGLSEVTVPSPSARKANEEPPMNEPVSTRLCSPGMTTSVELPYEPGSRTTVALASASVVPSGVAATGLPSGTRCRSS
jgi:hypothetical protein